jgi:hypothetical protein
MFRKLKAPIMKANIFEVIGNALSVGNWLQNTLFYLLLLLMIQVVLFQSKYASRLRSGR